MGGHGDQITMLDLCSFQDGACRLAAFMARRDGQVLAPEFRPDFFQILPVFFYFMRIGEIEVFLPLRRPPRGNVQQNDFGTGQARQFLDVRQELRIRLAVIERD